MKKNNSLLLTGGAGFIGSHLSERLISEQAQLTILDDLNDFYPPEVKRRNLEQVAQRGDFELIQVDIGDHKRLQDALSGRSYDAIIHLAARAGVRPSLVQPFLYERINIQGTLSLLEFARQTKCRKFIFASSSSIYGKNGDPPFSEDTVDLYPLSPYGVTKLAGEKLCHCFAHLYEMEVICLRLFTVYGPRQRPDLAIHKFTRLIEQNRPLSVFGDGHSLRDYTYIDDIVDGIMAALPLKERFAIFNLGSGRPISLKEMIHLLEKCLGKKAQLQIEEDKPEDMPFTLADLGKAKRILGYAPRVKFEEGLSHFVKWFREECSLKSDPSRARHCD